MNNFWKRTWAEINLDNLIYNYKTLKARLKADTKLCCVIKGNAYGHHAPRIASTLESEGADWFAVSNIEEALQLRNEGLKSDILILGYTPVDCAKVLADNDISQCVYSYEYASELAGYALKYNCNVRIHVKVDTGMGRIGFQYDSKTDVVSQMAVVCQLSGLLPEGIFTHLAVSDMGDEGKAFTLAQFEKFREITEALENRGIVFKYKHCANSAAAIDYPELQLDMVRVGISLYGLLPSEHIKNASILKPVMSLKTVVSHVKTVEKGTTVSYGCDFFAPRQMRIATVPMGYADGFWRSNVNASIPLYINGKKAFIVGRICMDQLMLDVSDVPDVKVGDEVTVFGNQFNSADAFAKANGTISYEIVCSVGKRVPRVFIKDGKIDGIHLGILDTIVN